MSRPSDTPRVAPPPVAVIDAPTNLGLRPPAEGREPGTWRAPDALRAAGLHRRLTPAAITSLPRPPYRFEAQPGTRIRNGLEIRRFGEALAAEVGRVLAGGNFPLVLGGDCSILLGCLLAVRRAGRCGLIHVDGHSDFFHPGNYDTASRLGSVAGMDLALATGRGEPLLTAWGDGLTPLVADADVVQIGERENTDADYAFPDIHATQVVQIDVRTVLRDGVRATARTALERLTLRGVSRIWLHADVDVLDQAVLPAVDSPGSPGLSFAQLTELIIALRESGKVLGADATIFDPDLDPDGCYAEGLTNCLVGAFGG
jgi:arginase